MLQFDVLFTRNEGGQKYWSGSLSKELRNNLDKLSQTEQISKLIFDHTAEYIQPYNYIVVY